jgi:hypothetical protein
MLFSGPVQDLITAFSLLPEATLTLHALIVTPEETIPHYRKNVIHVTRKITAILQTQIIQRLDFL